MENWYHGSPADITNLRTGSTITKHHYLACMFSHKPPIVSINDDGIIKHNGRENGLLYIVDEPIDINKDIEPHPRSTMGEGMEWITKRTLKLKLIEKIGHPKIEDILTEEEINELMKCRN
ncbi:hypothetical protein G5B47_00775 [Paenibacillus sp. 7124]|uniref:Uncharacterized protein n=1 Tax=Paenibacillus apii TaxID=1850370 RepID=A0A6M1PF58_9BACL|nr:hypothetical protein [Paenibacillus apii]NGM80938.1 hypothetical protein [Paenibacillus apii]